MPDAATLFLELGVALLYCALHFGEDGCINLGGCAALLLPFTDPGTADHAGGFILTTFLTKKCLPVVFALFVAVADVAGEHSVGDMIAADGELRVEMVNVGLAITFNKRLTAVSTFGLEMAPQPSSSGFPGILPELSCERASGACEK